jgi:hypothetical protein
MALPEKTGTVRVGVIGPADVVQRMIDLGHSLVVDESVSMRLVGTSYQKLTQIPDRVRGTIDEIDVALFAGPLPYDLARASGTLSRPATFVELAGSSLFGAMLRATRGGGIDLERVSIDSLSNAAIAEAYDECELSRRRVRSLPYDGPDSASQFADFHRQNFTAGRTSGALTTVEAVAKELARAKVPVVRVRATASALRSSLRKAAFLGAGSLLEAAQVVIGLIEIPELPRRTGHGAPGAWAAQELRRSKPCAVVDPVCDYRRDAGIHGRAIRQPGAAGDGRHPIDRLRAGFHGGRGRGECRAGTDGRPVQG